jgi:hypothetical protein
LLDTETIKELLADSKFSFKDKLLIALAHEPISPKHTSDIRDLVVALGQRDARKWNISSYLSKSKPFCIRGKDGWELTSRGREHVAAVAGPLLPSVTRLVVSALRKELDNITNTACRSFVEEAIHALEAKLYRSAIVLAWVGAISLLYEHVIAHKLADFNSEALKRDSKWRAAKTPDDLIRVKEFEFLQILVAISVLGKNVKDELEVCLKLRNGCGHPNSLIVGEHKASAHLETLIQNIFSKF